MTPEKKPTAGVLGSGAGVGVIFLAGFIENPSAKEVVLYLSPVAAVAVSTFTTWLMRFGARELLIYNKKRDLRRGRAQLDEILSDPNSSAAHRAAALAKFEEQRLELLTLHLEIPQQT